MDYFLILFLIAVVVIAFVRAKQLKGRREQDRRDGVVAVFGTLRLTGHGYLIVGYDPTPVRHDVTGMTARCETSGSVNRVKGKPVDDRSVTLTVEGPGFVDVREVPMRRNTAEGVNARVFASQVSAAGQRTYTAEARADAESRLATTLLSTPPPEALFNNGLQSQQRGDLVAAQDAYSRAASSGHPEAAPRAALNLGVLLNRQGDAAGALAAFETAMDSQHRDAGPIGALNLGDVLRDHGDLAGARAAYRRAVTSGHHNAAPKVVCRLAELGPDTS